MVSRSPRTATKEKFKYDQTISTPLTPIVPIAFLIPSWTGRQLSIIFTLFCFVCTEQPEQKVVDDVCDFDDIATQCYAGEMNDGDDDDNGDDGCTQPYNEDEVSPNQITKVVSKTCA